MKITSDLRVGIIGGAGKTGSQFTRLFQRQGFTVDVTGSDTSHRNATVLRECDIVIFSVPLAESADIIAQEMGHAVRQDQLLLDLSSLKSQQVSALLKGAGEVIGLHPLFGPWTDAAGETIIICPARCHQDTVDALENVLQAMGLKTKKMTAEAHDRLMALLQVLPHLKNLLVADALQKIDADIQEILGTCTPRYELELSMIGRFLDDSPALYGPMILDNPDTPKVLIALRDALNECIQTVQTKDLTRFAKRYESLQTFFGPHATEGRERTEACIRLLATDQR